MWKQYKKLLSEKRITQRELAKRTGLSPTTLSNIKKGRISFSNMVKVADALDVSLDEFREEGGKKNGNDT